jgi:hypothetical protein
MLRGVRGSEASTQLQDRRQRCRAQPIAKRINYHSSPRLIAVRGARLGDAAVELQGSVNPAGNIAGRRAVRYSIAKMDGTR